jgi:hypothetical protein
MILTALAERLRVLAAALLFAYRYPLCRLARRLPQAPCGREPLGHVKLSWSTIIRTSPLRSLARAEGRSSTGQKRSSGETSVRFPLN